MVDAKTIRMALVALALPLAGCVFPGHSRGRDHDHGQWRSNSQDCRYDHGHDNDCGPPGQRHDDDRYDHHGG